MTALWRALVLIWLAGPLAAQEAWVYSAPDAEDLSIIGTLHRAQITTEEATVALAWIPEDQTWRMFVLHDGWDPDPTRRLMAVYTDQQIEMIAVSATLVERIDSGETDLRFDVPEGFLDHLSGASVLNISRAAGPLEVPLRGSSAALDDLREARAIADEALAAQIAAAQEVAFQCDELAAWEGDAARVAPAVAWDDLDPDAAMRACFVASREIEDEPRYVFQLGRATVKAGLSGGLVWIRQAAAAGYPAARHYLSAPEG